LGAQDGQDSGAGTDIQNRPPPDLVGVVEDGLSVSSIPRRILQHELMDLEINRR
jgi:hypothetical protein